MERIFSFDGVKEQAEKHSRELVLNNSDEDPVCFILSHADVIFPSRLSAFSFSSV